MGLLKKVFGTKFSRDIKRVQPLVDRINVRYEELVNLKDSKFHARFSEADPDAALVGIAEDFTDPELRRWAAALTRRTRDLQHSLQEGLREALASDVEEEEYWEKALDSDLLVEAYAGVKAACSVLKGAGASWNVVGHDTLWDMVPYDVQLIGAIYMHRSTITEMATGEGKTLVATMPLYLNALTGRGAHLVTVNDYLARRDAAWMGGVYNFLGLTVGCIQHDMAPAERREAYACDITYGTNNEFGFDYLRDNGTATTPEQLVQRGHYFAIIDEVDSVLIDEARTPLIISGPAPESTHRFDKLNPLVRELAKKQHTLVTKLLTEADKLLKDETEESAQLAAQKLLLVRTGSPKNRRLLKILEDPSVKRLVQSVENELHISKGLSEFKEELYYSIEEKSFATDLTEKGRQALSPNTPDRFTMPDIDALMEEVDAGEADAVEREEHRKRVIDEAALRTEEIQNIIQLCKAYTLYERDVDYVVKDNRVLIVDQFTGRLMPGRRYSEGLHQALEAKEGVKIERETITLATITLQNYFRLYSKLSGMTGTAETEAQEFGDIYKLEVNVIPTNEPVRRVDNDDLIYKSRREKYQAVIEEIEQMRSAGRPILVGTVSVDVSETLSRLLKRRNIPHNVLNAKHHQSEAEIVREAGQAGRVTIATNMAGRGTDIKLGPDVVKCLYPAGHPLAGKGLCCIKCRRETPDGAVHAYECATCPKILAQCESGTQKAPPGAYKMPCGLVIDPASPQGDESAVRLFRKNDELVPCGLHIIGTERHDARRIDRQLRGRSGRQGDPGSSRFYLSVEDNLMRLFGSERIATAMERAGVEEGEPIYHPLITKTIGTAQKRVEDYHFGVRKRTLEYDDVVNKQREVIYELRRRIIEGRDLKEHILGLMEEAVEVKLDDVSSEELPPEDWDLDRLRGWYMTTFPALLKPEELEATAREKGREGLFDALCFGVERAYEMREAEYEPEQMRLLERFVLLSHLDTAWKEHLSSLDALREGIGLRSYGQRDPLVEYKKEAFEAFSEMIDTVNDEVVTRFFRYRLTRETAERARRRQESIAGRRDDEADAPARRSGKTAPKTKRDEAGKKLGRNDPCPCGSGKKYKKCCWDSDHGH
jgi:preprotein translocase subunit SecA